MKWRQWEFSGFYTIFLLCFCFIWCDSGDVQEHKKMTYGKLSHYFFSVYKGQNYLIIDPENTISEDEKEVIYYRMETLSSKLKIKIFVFILKEFSEENLDDAEQNAEFLEEFNVTLSANSSESNVDFDGSFVRKKMEKYVFLLREGMIKNEVMYREKENILILLISLTTTQASLSSGLNVKKFISEEESNLILSSFSQNLSKKGIYQTLDTVMSDLVFRHCPSTMDNFWYYLSYFGEIAVFIAVVLAFSYTNNDNGVNNVRVDNSSNNDNCRDNNGGGINGDDGDNKEKKL